MTEETKEIIRIIKSMKAIVDKTPKHSICVTEDGKEIKVDENKVAMLSFMFPPMKVFNVEVRTSVRHGCGVFATQDIPKGSIATLYAPDIVLFLPNGDREKEGHIIIPNLSTRMAKHITLEEACRYSDDFENYIVDVDDNYSLLGSSDFIEDPSYLGHMVNDSFMYNPKTMKPELYTALTNRKSNCLFRNIGDECAVAVIARRDIKMGEELLVTYGIDFWENYHRKREKENNGTKNPTLAINSVSNMNPKERFFVLEKVKEI